MLGKGLTLSQQMGGDKEYVECYNLSKLHLRGYLRTKEKQCPI